MPVVTEDAVRQLAAKLWAEDGHPSGKDVEYWLKAEAILTKEAAPAETPVVEAAAEAPASEEAPAKPKRKSPAKPRTTKPKAAPAK